MTIWVLFLSSQSKLLRRSPVTSLGLESGGDQGTLEPCLWGRNRPEEFSFESPTKSFIDYSESHLNPDLFFIFLSFRLF
jgi:hypothetical protein